jgi:antitoxin component of MazEF toxin-antitoxin module
MIEVKTKLRKWGNSFGIVVPIDSAEKEGAKEGDKIVALIKKERGNTLRETFGTYKSKKSTEKLMKEIDKELTYD